MSVNTFIEVLPQVWDAGKCHGISDKTSPAWQCLHLRELERRPIHELLLRPNSGPGPDLPKNHKP